jgi:hypothetical protein
VVDKPTSLDNLRYVLDSIGVKSILNLTHRVFGVILLVVPYLYFLLDRIHLFALVKKGIYLAKNEPALGQDAHSPYQKIPR